MISPSFRPAALALLLSCWFAADVLAQQHPAAGPPVSPYDAEVQARRERFEREAREHAAAAVVPLLGLSELWDLVDDRAALLAFVEAAEKHPGAPQDVRAQARAILRDFARH